MNVRSLLEYIIYMSPLINSDYCGLWEGPCSSIEEVVFSERLSLSALRSP